MDIQVNEASKWDGTEEKRGFLVRATNAARKLRRETFAT
jgi:hypothetical protein